MGNRNVVDTLGRVLIPAELRAELDIGAKDEVDIVRKGKGVFIQKQTIQCTFCKGTENLMEFGNRHICQDCREKIAKLK